MKVNGKIRRKSEPTTESSIKFSWRWHGHKQHNDRWSETSQWPWTVWAEPTWHNSHATSGWTGGAEPAADPTGKTTPEEPRLCWAGHCQAPPTVTCISAPQLITPSRPTAHVVMWPGQKDSRTCCGPAVWPATEQVRSRLFACQWFFCRVWTAKSQILETGSEKEKEKEKQQQQQQQPKSRSAFWDGWNPLIEVRFTAASQRNRVETETKKARLQLITIPLILLLHLLLFHSLSFYFFIFFVRVFIFHIHIFFGGERCSFGNKRRVLTLCKNT